jgi:hypothetical protein
LFESPENFTSGNEPQFFRIPATKLLPYILPRYERIIIFAAIHLPRLGVSSVLELHGRKTERRIPEDVEGCGCLLIEALSQHWHEGLRITT